MRIYVEIEDGEDLTKYLDKYSYGVAAEKVLALPWDELEERCNLLFDCYSESVLSKGDLMDIVAFGNLFNEKE